MQVPFYETAIFGALIGMIGTIASVVLGHYLNDIARNKENRMNFLIMIIQNHNILFSLIYRGSSNNIDDRFYAELRSEIQKASFIYFLPKDLKIYFMDLYNINIKVGSEYESRKNEIHYLCKSIIKCLNEFGVDAIGDK